MAVEKPGPAIFITGTDTGVGKTSVSCALAVAAHQAGQFHVEPEPLGEEEADEEDHQQADHQDHQRYPSVSIHQSLKMPGH